MRRTYALTWILCMLSHGAAFPQADTIRISPREAEEQFLQRNLLLVASRFNIDAAKAAVSQAGLWSNPTFSLEQNIYNQYTGKWFDVTATGNTGIQIQQLFLLAGKRGKQVRLAEIDAENAGNEFFDVMRALKFRLRTSLYDLYFLRQSVGFYDESIATLSKTVTVTEGVYERRSILLAELLRLKSLLFSLQNERLGLLGKIADCESALRVLLRDTTGARNAYVTVLNTDRLEIFRPDSLQWADAAGAALANRPDLKKAYSTVLREEANLEYQKSLATPDLTVGGLWSRAGSYIPDYYALTLSIDLPIFNRNQGNIDVSARTLESDRAMHDNERKAVLEEVSAALRRASELERLYRSFDRKFPLQYHALVDGMIANYQKRNMSVIEFTDFIESYRTSMLQMNQLGNDRADSMEMLNYVTGTDLFTP
ncbi:MAG TPA: TolC family protein [Bacteroidota bacterium]|nr:TolC family protein [Bacteroidota bacterium]